jgi:hypothetical protein
VSKYYKVMTFMLGFPELCWVELGKSEEARELGFCLSCGESPLVPKWAEKIGGRTIPIDFDPRRPGGQRLTGLLRNTDSALILHRAYTDEIRKLCSSGIHYFPAVVYNHKGRVASNDYEIVVPWPLRDVANLQASDVLRKDDGTVDHIYKVVLDPAKLTDDLVLFRVLGNKSEYFISHDLMLRWKAVEMEDALLYLKDVPVQAVAQS